MILKGMGYIKGETMTKNSKKVLEVLTGVYAFKMVDPPVRYYRGSHSKAFATRSYSAAKDFINSTGYRKSNCQIEKVIYDKNKFTILSYEELIH